MGLHRKALCKLIRAMPSKQHCKQASGNTHPTTVDAQLNFVVVSTIFCALELAVHVRPLTCVNHVPGANLERAQSKHDGRGCYS